MFVYYISYISYYTFLFLTMIMFSLEDSNTLQSHFLKQKYLKENQTSLIPQQAISIRDSTITIEDKLVAPTLAKLSQRFVSFFFALYIINLVYTINATIIAIAMLVYIYN